MAYGLTVENNSGRTTIDENSRQVQVLKSGSTLPKPISTSYNQSNTFRYGGSANINPSPIIIPGNSNETFIFIGGERISGTYVSSLHVGVQYGTCSITWTSTSATVVGTNYIYASFTKTSASIAFPQSVPHVLGSTTINDDPTADCVGGVVGSYGNWASGFSTPYVVITKIESTSTSGVYKLFLNGTWASVKSSGQTAKVITKDVVWFYSPSNSGFTMASYGSADSTRYQLNYKFGTLTDNAEETAGYGLEVFNSSGKLAFSSNRVNFQIESITTGLTDVIPHATQLGRIKTGSGTANPVIYKALDNPSSFEDYYIMVTGSGSEAAFAGATAYGNNPYTWVFGVGYAMAPFGQSAFNNATMGSKLGGQVVTQSIGSSNAGFSMSPILLNNTDTNSQVSGGSYVSDTYAIEATRSLVIGRFI